MSIMVLFCLGGVQNNRQILLVGVNEKVQEQDRVHA
jgi:hypothetical protein